MPRFITAYDCSCADWDGLCDHLRDVPWENIFKLSAFTAASKFCEWVQVEMMCMSFIVSIRSNLTHPYGFQQLVLAHRNHFFRLYQQNKSSELKVKFRQASN